MKPTRLLLALIMAAGINALSAQDTLPYNEPFRNQFHFSPKYHWMNDPNGLVYHKGKYHLFFQYYPEGIVWGPMHWGHATSADLLHWQELPIALYPDSIGDIFSGSIVLDKNNSSGFGTAANPPLVAIYTQHNMGGEHAGRSDFQNQSIAWSVDEGRTWNKYRENPVLKNPGIKDFRDPKVSWYQPGKKWIMTLATKDRITFYSSKNLKQWGKESEFGQSVGAHGGVWECPDLFALDCNGKKIWVLLVSINPGGPNGGSATQYFTGTFNGKTFAAFDTLTRWVDYGTDNYAGVTYDNTANRRITIGWMSNWQYANIVPTANWRGANTLPRTFSLVKGDNGYLLCSAPVTETKILERNTTAQTVESGKTIPLAAAGQPSGKRIAVEAMDESFEVLLLNKTGDTLQIGYDKQKNIFYINRTKAGITNFEPGFGAVHVAPRLLKGKRIKMEIWLDKAAMELFADGGSVAMTDVFFAKAPFDAVLFRGASPNTANIKITSLKGIW
ncbi:MAG: glycoside hydrolase family 32 protein [Edaphocola sp.]